MKDKKEILRKTSAFVTSLIFVFSTVSRGFVCAEEVTESFCTEAESTEVQYTETSEITEASETGPDITEENNEKKTVKIVFKVNGTSDYNQLDIFDKLFKPVFVTDVSDDGLTVNIFPDELPEKKLWKQEAYDSGENIFIRTDNSRYRLDSVKTKDDVTEVCLTEYYDISSISINEISILSADGELYDGKYVAYDSWLRVQTSEGWIIDETAMFKLRGDILPYISSTNNEYTLVIRNGDRDVFFPIRKSEFSVSCSASADMNIRINSSEGFEYKGFWIDSDAITGEFELNENSRYKITEAELRNTGSNKIYPMEIKGDGKKVTASLNTDSLEEKFTDGEEYCFDLKIVSDVVKVETYISGSESEELYGKLEYETSVKDSECFINVPPVIFENGVAKYIIDSYECGSGKQWIDAKRILEEGKIYDFIQVLYDSNVKIIYKKIIIDDIQKYYIDSNILKCKDKNAFIVKDERIINVMDFNEDIKYIMLYDELLQGISKNYLFVEDNFRYLKRNNDITALTINSILYYENNEFHNMLQEPLYFYFDDHAPEIQISNAEDNTFDDSYWSKKVYRFTIDVNDAEAFPQVSGADEEVNAVYGKIDGAASEITGITVGGYKFEKVNGKWKKTKTDSSVQYSASLEEITDTKFEILVAVFSLDNIQSIEKEISVTASDRCGNVSEPRTFELKIDNNKPAVSSAKIRNALHYTAPAGGRTAAVGNNCEILNDRFLLDIEAYDDFSGLRSVQVEYSSFTEKYTIEELQKNSIHNFSRDGSRYFFSLPLNAEYSWRSLIKITVEDKAGNSCSFYYNDDETPVLSADSESYTIVDRNNPEVNVSVQTLPEYSGTDRKQWYSRIPEFSISADDDFDKVNSGIRNLYFTVNGVQKKAEDIFAQQTDDFRITAEHSPDDPNIAEIFYTYGTDKVRITETDLKKSDGKIQVEIYAEDAAGNYSDISSATVFVDANPPEAEKYFSIENENDNYRAFGTFLNHSVKVCVNVSEPDGKPSAGLREAVLYYGERKISCTFDSEKSATAEFKIPYISEKDIFSSGQLKIILTDNTGNKYTSDYLLNPKGSDLVMFESAEPEIIEYRTDSTEKYRDENNNLWYSSDVNFSFKADDSEGSDVYSGLKNFQAEINGKNIIFKDYRDLSEITSGDRYRFSTSDAEEPDGKYDIFLRAEDNAGNIREYRKTVFTDKTAPVITGMSIEGVGSVPVSILNGIYALPYGYFFRNECKITVYAKDENASSGLEKISISLYSMDGTLISENNAEKLNFDNGEYSGDFTVPEGFKGYITVSAADNTGNVSEKYTPQGFITESSERHGSSSSLRITLPETQYTDRSGLPLYNGDVRADIELKDSFSGIQKAEWNLSEYGENAWKQITIDSSGKISGDSTENFTVSECDRNLVLSVSGEAVSRSDKNAAEIKIRMTDNAGNISEAQEKFSIDRNAPEINVTWENAVSDSKSGIYSSARTAQITVRERNFDSERIKINVEGDQGGVSYGQWTLVSGTEGTDSALYRMPVTFSGDGEYILSAEGTDMCDNRSRKYTSEKFVIDRTAPVTEVISSGAELINGQYYNGTRTLTIRITEHNFDASRIKITGTSGGSEDAFPKISDFTSAGDVHTAVLTLSENAEYTISIEGEDAAGNAFAGYSDSFIIDSEAPEIVFEGVKDRSANNGDVSLTVFIRDKNISADKISMKVTGSRQGDITEKSGVLEGVSDGYVFRFREFTREKETDDIYTVTVKAVDNAGNQSFETLTFSVNRFGSTYVFDEKTVILANTYINKPADIILHEINADRLLMEKTRIQVVKDAEITELKKDRDYTVEENGETGSWYDYQYTIKADNFADDAAYQVIVLSEDAAGNKNANSIEDKEAMLKFGVDQTPPKCIPINIESGGAYRTDSLEAELQCEDNTMLTSLDVYVNGEQINDLIKVENNKCSFTLSAADTAQDIKVVLLDIAGNEGVTNVDNILVSNSRFRVIIHKPAFRKTLAATALCGAAAAGGISLRRRKIRGT